ncbi:hypothetical protein MSP8887_03239 [Marinomonas spartinae]|uniref:Uncharacterized protein n=1 Tax=Marinomonas spartinae TaxID=1792290 RepID=A0A1A8TLG7_9GAMM|nr:hypothetical protein [Marinomonas spartinae]SBS34735.1 hypothetical protein MSP8886_03154 [Marinomonas spartinae]SBS38244.1 hypothetical protein MSP8887_03239 [Marinomonas spartinae]
MTAFSISIADVSLPHALSVDDVLTGSFLECDVVSGEMTWQAFTYDCIMKAKSLYPLLQDTSLPTIWLLPAWAFQYQQKEIVIETFNQLFSTTPELVFFQGSSGMDAAIKMMAEQGIDEANIIAVDGVYLANSSAEYCYYGVGGLTAKFEISPAGWSQRFFHYETTIDFIQHDAFKALFLDASEGLAVPIDIIFSPGNGVAQDGDTWLHSLQLLAPHLSEDIDYVFPAYLLGKIGAMSGVINLYSLINNPCYRDSQHALMISQEQSVHQAVGSYVWTNEEAHS